MEAILGIHKLESIAKMISYFGITDLKTGRKRNLKKELDETEKRSRIFYKESHRTFPKNHHSWFHNQ